ncbi:unnamed protein product [Meganyctiphanes norvegica]|uniref:Uncharacterized protein n=1 Tax=Meganyctiphanes norvegica TaxID=48144 RepID=A0AAV2RWY3_MEGNR
MLADESKEQILSEKIPGDAALDDDSIADLQKMVESIREGRIKQLEDEVEEWTSKLLDKNLFQDLDETEIEEEEQRLGKALSSLMDSLGNAEDKLFKARADMETLEEFLDSQLQEMELEDPQEHPSQEPQDSQDTPTSHPQDPTERDSQQEQSTDGSKKETKKILDSKIIKSNAEEEKHKNQLEEKIKDKLQKLGLDKIGRKFEVKILTPNSLEEDDKNSLSSMSQEETEAFQNMIVNLLSANAEEIEERENHRKLEKNYAFNWDDMKIPDEEDSKIKIPEEGDSKSE